MKRYIATLLLAITSFAVQAREVFPLNEGWRFFFKSENTSDNARHVTLPHSWNTDAEAEGLWLETTGNYQNDMYLPQGWADKRLFVKFYGVQSVADLFVNGRHAGTHRGGATAFAFEITDYVRFGTDNSLLVVVSNSQRNDVLPTSTDMNLYGGIYREAELIVTDRTAISPLYLGSDGVLLHPHRVDAAAAEGEAEIHLTSKGENTCTVRLDITDPEGRPVFSRHQRARLDGKPVIVPFSVENPALWSPDSPSLYTVTASIGEDSITDRVVVRTGFRSVAPAPSGGLWLNGVLTPIRGVAFHHTMPLSAAASRPRTTMPIWRESAMWGPMPCGRLSCPTRSTSTTVATSRACWSGSTSRSTAPRSWAMWPISPRRSSRRTASSSCARSWRRTSTIPRCSCGGSSRACVPAATTWLPISGG